MSDYIATNYDRLLQDETSHVMPNIHSEGIQDEIDPSAHWNEDDNETIVHESDWLFIGYRETQSGSSTKFVLHQDNFLDMVDEYGANSLLMCTLRIVSGDDWLRQKQEELK